MPYFVLASLVLLLLSGLFPLVSRKASRRCCIVAATGLVVGCLTGLVPAIGVLATGDTVTFRASWNVPYGSFFLEIDALTAFFLVPILILGAVASVYGVGYLEAERDHLPARPAWFFTALLIAGMAAVVMARNAILFLVAWEIMSMAAFFLVTLDSESDETRSAGWTYLVATHLGTAFLFALFLIIGQKTGSLDFDQWGAAASALSAGSQSVSLSQSSVASSSVSAALSSSPLLVSLSLPVSLLFLFAVIGFGTKAGLMPFHVWLPEAHPAAPSHVSALMSGVMIKTGVYGILRTLMWLGPPPAWWGWTLLAMGLVSGVAGVVYALAQQDLKRLLAYSSVENIGIIAMGMGIGLVGRSVDMPLVAALGFGGALLHVWNHAAFKGLLFLGAGSVAHGAGTRNLDRLGGLIRRMPWTGGVFVVGAVAIVGLPPLNGFIGEFLIYRAAFTGGAALGTAKAVGMLAAIAGLALIGGLAAVCFAKAFGMAFLGEPRSNGAAHAHESARSMLAPMTILAATCVAIGLAAPWAIFGARFAIAAVAGIPNDAAASVEMMDVLQTSLYSILMISLGLILLIAALAGIRTALQKGREVGEAGTWDCGFARPTNRMQYTGSSFVQPMTRLFQWILHLRATKTSPAGLFPRDAAFSSEGDDAVRTRFFAPLFSRAERLFVRFHRIQEGRVQIYVLYIVLTLLILLLWKL